MMHQNKLISKLYKLKRRLFDKNFLSLRYVSYSIPLACVMVLLFGLVYGIIFVDSGFNGDEVFAESVTSSNSNASLTITENDLHTTAAPGSIAYVSTNISYSTTNVENYTLKISYAENYNSLQGDSADASTISDIANNTLSDNSWGYAWSDDNSIAESSFNNLTYTSVPSYNNGNNLASGNTNISSGTGKLIFAAKFASNAVTTNYKTSVLLALATTPSAITYTLTFDANGGTGAPSGQTYTGIESSHSFIIPDTVPTRTGYKFLGWAESNTATAEQYSINDGITIKSTNGNVTKTLFAVWQPPFNGITQMQQMTTTICSAATIGDSTTLTDTRDDYTYTVAKLADNKCWMTQNLRITRESIQAKTPTNTTGQITYVNSNVSNSYDIPASITTSFSISKKDDYYTNQEVRAAENDIYGAYYSHNVATVNTLATSSSGTSSYSICPRGWILPTGSNLATLRDYGSIQVGSLDTRDSTTDGWWLGTSVINSSGGAFFPAAGYVEGFNSGLVGTGTFGYYWASNVSGTDLASMMQFYNGRIQAGAYIARYRGQSVRCIAK